MLKETEKNTGAMGIGKVPSHDVIAPPKLEELGITAMQSHRWQLESEIPEAKFEQFIAETKAATEELTSRAALGIALKMRHEDRKQATSDTTIPEGLFEVIAIDPPWNYGREFDPYSSRVASPYKEMSIEEIMTLDIPAADNCAIWLWTTNTFMHESLF
jgi:hypothetical protein